MISRLRDHDARPEYVKALRERRVYLFGYPRTHPLNITTCAPISSAKWPNWASPIWMQDVIRLSDHDARPDDIKAIRDLGIPTWIISTMSFASPTTTCVLITSGPRRELGYEDLDIDDIIRLVNDAMFSNW